MSFILAGFHEILYYNCNQRLMITNVTLLCPQVSESWWNNVQGVDNQYSSGLSASILSLQESYLSLLEKKGAS